MHSLHFIAHHIYLNGSRTIFSSLILINVNNILPFRIKRLTEFNRATSLTQIVGIHGIKHWQVLISKINSYKLSSKGL